MKKYDGLLIDKHSVRDKRFKIQLKSGQTYTLMELEHADLSYVPCGQVPDKKSGELKDQPLLSYRDKWGKEAQVTLSDYADEASLDWKLESMNGVQLMTGRPTHRYSEGSPLDDLIYLTDIDIEHRLIGEYPEHYQRIVNVYRDACEGTPCRIRTKSDGERLSAYIAYLDSKVSFTDPKTTDDEKPMLLEIFSEMGLSRLDNRYDLIEGNILDIPILPISALQEIHTIISEVGTSVKTARGSTQDDKVFATSQIGDLDIDWRKKTITPKDGSDPYDVLVSQRLPTEHCRLHAHTSNRDEIQFTKYANGSIRGYCHNEQEGWWEGSPLTNSQYRPDAIPEPLTPEQEQAEVERIIANAPDPEPVTYYPRPSQYFTPEHKRLIRAERLNPMADSHEVNSQQIPLWVTQYEKLNPLFGGCDFAMNGQPQEAEKHRVWNTAPKTCPECGGKTLFWLDRFRYRTGYYCDTCHKDLPLTSLLKLELNRHLAGSFTSRFEGYISDDPFWQTTPLWGRGRVTFLAASMNKGKTTFANSQGVALAQRRKTDYILCVPRISLAIEQHQKLTEKYGEGSFGLFHEGSKKSIGRLGAVCCLSSLPNVFGYEDYLTGERYDAENALIFIDEVDFSYELLNLVSVLSRTTKAYLETALHTNGLVLSGQTEYTAVVEAFLKELGTDQILGYYNAAIPHETPAEVVLYPDVDGKTTWALADLVQYIREIIDAGLHAYVFCATRRAVSVLRDEFFELDPLTFTSLSKNLPRVRDFLKNEKLTDTPLFLATSAAAVGISIIDPKARTAILAGLVRGHLNCADIVQESVRDRGQHPLRIFLPAFENAFPVSQTDATDVSRYELLKKRAAEELADTDIKNADKLAATYGLKSLAEDDPLTFITHHLQNIAGFDVQITQPEPPCEIAIQHIKDLTKLSLETEKAETQQRALEVLARETERLTDADYTPPHIFSTSEIRKMSATDFTVLANLKATEAVIVVGFDDQTDIERSGDPDNPVAFDWFLKDLETATAIVSNAIDTKALKQRMFGYIAARNTVLGDEHWEKELESGKELSAVKDYRFIGELVALIVDRLSGKRWETEVLQTELKKLLDTQIEDGSTYLSEIKKGAIGVNLWRKARFLNIGVSPIQFCLELATDFYPCVVKRYKGVFSLHNDPHLTLFADALNCYLDHQRSQEMRDLDDAFGDTGNIVTVNPLPETDSPKQALYAKVVELAKQEKSVKEIVAETGVSPTIVKELTKEIRDAHAKAEDAQLKARTENMLEMGVSLTQTAKALGISRRKLDRILNL